MRRHGPIDSIETDSRCKNLADRAKTRWAAPYARAESKFSRFSPVCATVGREIRTALFVSRSFRTVRKIFATSESASKKLRVLRDEA
jgi:hypothetical protein